MTIPAGLYEWPDALDYTFRVRTVGGKYSCDVWQWGEQIAPSTCTGPTGVPSADLEPSQARDFVGVAPNTPVDLIFPADRELVEDYVYVSDFNPAPDWARVTYLVFTTEGPQWYSVGCDVPNTEGGPRSGGCGDSMPPDIADHVTTTSGVGSVVDQVVVPPAELAYDASEYGSTLWPAGRLGDAAITVSYTNAEGTGEAAVGSVTKIYSMSVRLYWEVDQTPPLGQGNITIGTLTRGVRRRVAAR